MTIIACSRCGVPRNSENGSCHACGDDPLSIRVTEYSSDDLMKAAEECDVIYKEMHALRDAVRAGTSNIWDAIEKVTADLETIKYKVRTMQDKHLELIKNHYEPLLDKLIVNHRVISDMILKTQNTKR